jgi:hypothetical protein
MTVRLHASFPRKVPFCIVDRGLSYLPKCLLKIATADLLDTRERARWSLRDPRGARAGCSITRFDQRSDWALKPWQVLSLLQKIHPEAAKRDSVDKVSSYSLVQPILDDKHEPSNHPHISTGGDEERKVTSGCGSIHEGCPRSRNRYDSAA